MLTFGIGDYLKLGVAALAGALLVSGPVYLAGRSDGKDAGRLEAAKEAGQRITQMEKNNAEFNRLSDRDQCLVFMHDSELPAEACD